MRNRYGETNMREYMRWIALTFPNELVPGSSIAFPVAVARFKERFPRDSHEYGDTLNYFMLQAARGQRYMRLRVGVVEFVEAIAIAVHVIEQIATHADSEMHEYIQWIRRNRGQRELDHGGLTISAVVDHFLEHVHRDSPMYLGVFRSFLSNRAAKLAPITPKTAWTTSSASSDGSCRAAEPRWSRGSSHEVQARLRPERLAP
jgi:hypothetical protein